MQVQNFRADASGAWAEESLQIQIQIHCNRAPDRQPVQLLLVGDRASVNAIIHRLHALNFAEVFEWTEALPTPHQISPKPGHILRTLTKYLSKP